MVAIKLVPQSNPFLLGLDAHTEANKRHLFVNTFNHTFDYTKSVLEKLSTVDRSCLKYNLFMGILMRLIKRAKGWENQWE